MMKKISTIDNRHKGKGNEGKNREGGRENNIEKGK